MGIWQTVISLLIPISQLVLATVLGCITVYIAWQQWRTNHNQFRLHFYDRRISVYDAVLKFAAHVANKGSTVANEELREFVLKTHDASFIFNDEVQAYCNELSKKAVDLNTAQQLIETAPDAPNYADMVRLHGELLIWFTEQVDKAAKVRFEPFLRIREDNGLNALLDFLRRRGDQPKRVRT